MEVKIGTCGWGYLNPSQFYPNWKEKFKDKLQVYVSVFDVGEVNYTYYKLPDENVMKLWRERADEIKKDFEFTLKASKYITHIDKFQSKSSINEFNRVKKLARILRSKIIIIQTSSSFKPTLNNLKLIEHFLDNIDKEDFILGWEFRGKEWLNKNILEKIKKLFDKYSILHVIDLFLGDPLNVVDNTIYTRLHGSPPGKRQYYYKYTQKDFEFIAKKLEKYEKEGVERIYIMFDTVGMYEDSKKLEKFLKEKGII